MLPKDLVNVSKIKAIEVLSSILVSTSATVFGREVSRESRVTTLKKMTIPKSEEHGMNKIKLLLLMK